jgi:electron transfer flavoprotein alpha subunit
MAKAFVLVEHRRGSIREATFECVTLARELQAHAGLDPAAVVLGSGAAPFAASLAKYLSETILIDHADLKDFRYEAYATALRDLIGRETPLIVIAPHSAFGMELVPRLSAELNLPCATDCTAVGIENGLLTVQRSIHNGKINERVAIAGAEGGCFVTVRAGSYAPAVEAESDGTIREYACPEMPSAPKTEFRGYRETAAGAVDITQAPFLMAIGRGIKDAENIPKVQAIADRLGAVLAR